MSPSQLNQGILMNNYFELHSLELSTQSNTEESPKKEQLVKELKEKIFSEEKQKKQNSKKYKLKLTILLFLTHFFVFILATMPEDSSTKVAEPEILPATKPNHDEVLLSVSLIFLSSFQKDDNALWVDIYSPKGELFFKKISLLKNSTNEETNSTENNLIKEKTYNIIVKKSDAAKILKIAQKNYHALPHGIVINRPPHLTKSKKTVKARKNDPFQKPWRT